MAKNKKDINFLFIIVGIILAIAFIGKTNFLGTFFTTCENIEPKTISEYAAAIQGLDGFINPTQQLYVDLTENNTVVLQEYESSSLIGEINLIDAGAIPCNMLLAGIRVAQNGSFVTLNNKNILSVQDTTFYWCNKDNNVVLYSDEIESFSNYWAQFEICTIEEVIDEIEDENATVDDDETVTSSSTSTGSSITTTTATSGTASTSFGELGGSTEDIEKNRLITILIGGALILFVGYWYFERGPKRGLFKKK